MKHVGKIFAAHLRLCSRVHIGSPEELSRNLGCRCCLLLAIVEDRKDIADFDLNYSVESRSYPGREFANAITGERAHGRIERPDRAGYVHGVGDHVVRGARPS